METIKQSQPETALWASALFVVVLALCTVGPWVLHFTLAWWAGLIAIPVSFAVYIALLAPRDGICLGIAFIYPLLSAVVFIGFQLLLFAKWTIDLLGSAGSA